MNEKRENDQVSLNMSILLHNFLTLLRRIFWIILLVPVLVGGLSYYRTDRSFHRMYSSTVVFSVQASYAATTDILSHSIFLDASAAQVLAQTFPYVIQSENCKMLLCNELGRDDIPASIQAVSTADTGLFTMTVTGSDPQLVFDTMKAAIKVYPQAASPILGDTQVEIINMPNEPSSEPINQNTAKEAALRSASFALVVMLGLTFLFSLARKTVHSAEDLRRLINVRCLAYVPMVKIKKHSNKVNQLLTINNHRVPSSFNESIRNLRVKLHKALPKRSSHVIMITSTLPNEGKTTVATNLALSLATEGKKVILVDGDLRKQSLKDTIGLTEPSDGLVDILSGKTQNFHLLNVPRSTLLLLSGDNTIDQPQPLLDTPKMRQLLDTLRERMDYIIIDTPPAGILSDAATLAKYVDATVYVVRQDHANSTQILDSIQALSASGANIVGSVLNQTLTGTTRYGYGNKYKEGYGYSYGSKYALDYHKYSYSPYSGRYARNGSHYQEARDEAEYLTQEIATAIDIAEDE